MPNQGCYAFSWFYGSAGYDYGAILVISGQNVGHISKLCTFTVISCKKLKWELKLNWYLLK